LTARGMKPNTLRVDEFAIEWCGADSFYLRSWESSEFFALQMNLIPVEILMMKPLET
jgi:hypothetical protein